MSTAKKATVYFDPEIHRAVRVKAAQDDQSISDLVNEALKLYLSEDAEDIEAYRERKDGPFVSYDQLLKNLKDDGII
jgi:hypothetical protein